jgi:hypothetical protein
MQDEGWSELLSRLPADIEQRARGTSALRRARRIRSGEQLLRLILIYVTCWLSLRETAAWAGRVFGIKVTDGALGYRFACAVRFLRELVESMLQDQLVARERPGPAVRIVDGTGLNEPGSKGTDWRLHVTYTPSKGLVGAEMTDAEGGEHLSRAAARPGDLLIVDRGYGHAGEVRTARARNEEFFIRVHLQSVRVADQRGTCIAPLTLVRRAAARGVVDEQVLLPEKGHESVAARLVMMPMPREKAARARQKLRHAAAKKGRSPNEVAMKLAGYFCCLTSVSADRLAPAVLVSWYRIRWQVELWFKRSKSLLGLDHLTKASPMLIAIQVWGRLLVALLIQRLQPALADVPTHGEPPISPWRLTRVLWLDVVLAVYGGASLSTRLDNSNALERLRERRRKRTFDTGFAQEIERIFGGAQLGGAPV